MNRSEMLARYIYTKNREKIERDGDKMNIFEIMKIAKEQDRLYRVIYRRWDAKSFAC